MFTSYTYIHQYVGVGVTRRFVLQRDSMYHFAFAVYNDTITIRLMMNTNRVIASLARRVYSF